MKSSIISSTTLQFLKDLQENNDRGWFAKEKDRFVAAKENMQSFADALLAEIEQHDEIEKMKVYRIYRDVRFSKDKSPYKNYLSGSMMRATKWRRGGMYFHIEPNGKSMIGGGFWNPNSADLARIRQEIAADDSFLRKIIAAPNFKKHFGELEGNQVKTAPRGYAKDHPAIDLLRYKQFLLGEYFTDKEVTSKNFIKKATTSFLAMRPFFDYMSDVLTTDSNGVPIE